MVNLRVSGWSHDAATGYLCPCFRCRDDLGRLGDSCNSPARRKASSQCGQPLAYAREYPAGRGCAGDRRDLAQPRTVTWHAHGHLCDRSHAPAGCLAVRDDRRNCRVPAVIPGRGHLAMCQVLWVMMPDGRALAFVSAPAPRLPIRLDHGCAAKTWATAPPLNAPQQDPVPQASLTRQRRKGRPGGEPGPAFDNAHNERLSVTSRSTNSRTSRWSPWSHYRGQLPLSPFAYLDCTAAAVQLASSGSY
jgi:hypothetical protein